MRNKNIRLSSVGHMPMATLRQCRAARKAFIEANYCEPPSMFASLAPGERVSHERDGGYSVLRFTPGAPGTVHIETVRRYDAQRRPVAFDADPRWSLHYGLPGHENKFFDGRYENETAAAAAWQALSIERSDAVTVST